MELREVRTPRANGGRYISQASIFTRKMSNSTSEREDDERAHLSGIEDGCGCAEVWETLSEQRAD
jgi:hypothetical protein